MASSETSFIASRIVTTQVLGLPRGQACRCREPRLAFCTVRRGAIPKGTVPRHVPSRVRASGEARGDTWARRSRSTARYSSDSNSYGPGTVPFVAPCHLLWFVGPLGRRISAASRLASELVYDNPVTLLVRDVARRCIAVAGTVNPSPAWIAWKLDHMARWDVSAVTSQAVPQPSLLPPKKGFLRLKLGYG